jgi:hypothetical protein
VGTFEPNDKLRLNLDVFDPWQNSDLFVQLILKVVKIFLAMLQKFLNR